MQGGASILLLDNYDSGSAPEGARQIGGCGMGATVLRAQPGPRIPVAPLLAAIEGAGGLGALPGLGRPVVTAREDGAEFVGYERTDEQRREWERLRKLLRRQSKVGWIDLFLADEICCDHLRVHPMEVYGWAWIDDFNNDKTGV